MTYTNPKNQATVTTEMNLVQAYDVLCGVDKEKRSEFARSLMASYPRFSDAQKFWFFKLAEDIKNPNKKLNQGMDAGAGFARIQGLFATARSNGLLRPKIRLETSIGEKVAISLAPDAGKNANHLYIKISEVYAGKISPDGKFFSSADCTDAWKDYLKSFADNPIAVAVAYGHRTGNCSFCSRTLTDKRSVTVGYGPICAEKFALPWGD